ncbi:MAG TPA: hypothetical protein GX401_08330 [Clostridiales bacterium]|nr:hypothetical protein [Clostridiales bacterium]
MTKKIISILLLVCVLFTVTACFGGPTTLNYKYKDADIHETLSDDTTARLKAMFDSKQRYDNKPKSEFDDNVSISIGGRLYDIALNGDTKVKDVAVNKYFNITDEELKEISDIFAKYNAQVPCY